MNQDKLGHRSSNNFASNKRKSVEPRQSRKTQKNLSKEKNKGSHFQIQHRNVQNMPFKDKTNKSKFFQYFPPHFNKIDPIVYEAEKKIFKEAFYSQEHIFLRRRCLEETKKVMKKLEKVHDPKLFKIIFVQIWPKLLNEVKQAEDMDQAYFANKFYCQGQEAFHIAQLDLLKLILRKPLSKFTTGNENSLNKNAIQQFQKESQRENQIIQPNQKLSNIKDKTQEEKSKKSSKKAQEQKKN